MEDSDRKSGPLARIQTLREPGGPLADRVDTLLTEAFAVPQGAAFRASYYDDFPVWRPGGCQSAALHVGLDALDRVLGCAGLRITELLGLEGRSVRLGIVGAVATLPAARGLGVGTRLVEFCIEQARRGGCEAVVLWDSSESSMYSRLGFREFGTQCLMRLSDFPVKGSPLPGGGTRVGTGWSDSLFEFLRQRKSGLRLIESDIGWIRRHRNVEWYWIEGEGCLRAACALGRGIDLQGIVHEWHGQSGYLGPLFDQVLKKHPGALLMGPDMGDITLDAHRMAVGMVLPLVPALEPESWWFWGLDSA